MGKRTSKADIILREADLRTAKAHAEVQEAQSALLLASAKWSAHQEAYAALERSLARKPATPKTPKTPKAPKDKKPDTDPPQGPSNASN